ncbi:ATP-dependent DNA helicase PIF1-like [Corticium candelabrum]|uniref:ATP-dependent DNA helicase PIF1-like n=1 Tax=Corticium candelabrum TaxID=121492 RepID=UPI002E2773F0|nr:ATP-dependent DNA helicase PIF1-like [Corticium candelabrum]XP_062509313.1 ATP-dependent DNA helicase PIF1-like [Corticium candelabrum]
MEATCIQCSLAIESLSGQSTCQRKSFAKAELTLGRNENGSIMIQLNTPQETITQLIKQHTVHTKFLRDGKATIRLITQGVQLLISNCPPDNLASFVKTLEVKLAARGDLQVKRTGARRVLHTFNEISPLTGGDVKAAIEKTKSSAMATTPCREHKAKTAIKRKLATEKNESPQLSLPMNKMPELTAEQVGVLTAVQQGKNVFFTGSAGTGKSYLLKRIIGSLPPSSTFATASTGVAACHIGGTTLHAFAGIGSGDGDVCACVAMASKQLRAERWRRCRHLIIDEISMIDAEYFDKVETVARKVRQCERPFGGIQLVICGDFLQLPPVIKDGREQKFCFQADSWKYCLEVSLHLSIVHRQTDLKFIKILQYIRTGRCPTIVADILSSTSTNVIEHDGIMATRLCTHKENVDSINRGELAKLKGMSKTFESTDSAQVPTSQMDALFPVKSRLELKLGAQVMLTKNLDIQRGLVNGARGIVLDFVQEHKAAPVVKFASGLKRVITPEVWSVKTAAGNVLTRKQLPLKLAWALSIHKSQGMSLDCVEMSLSRVFESGQAYVALSRARSLQGLRVLDFDRNCVRANPTVLKFYHQLKQSQSIPGPQTPKRIKYDEET